MELRPKAGFNGIDISEIRKMNALAGSNTINLGIGQLPNDLPEPLLEQGDRAFKEGVTRYTSNQGMSALRELVASYHSKKSEKNIEPDQVVITNGAEGALWNILYTYLDRGDEIIIPEIAFTVYDTISKMQGATAKFYNSVDQLEDLVTDKTKFVVINSPNNPTGKITPKEDIEKLSKLTDKHGFYIISDEIYSELYLDGVSPVSPLEYTDKVIIVDGISKRAAATGLRIGWTVAPVEITKPMIVANQYISTCASSVSQFTAIKSLDGSSDSFVEDIKKGLKVKRDLAYKELSLIEGVKVDRPDGAFYIFPDISAFGTSKEVALEILNKTDVLTIPGMAFGAAGDKHIRLSYAVSLEDLTEGLSRIKELLSNWSNNES